MSYSSKDAQENGGKAYQGKKTYHKKEKYCPDGIFCENITLPISNCKNKHQATDRKLA